MALNILRFVNNDGNDDGGGGENGGMAMSKLKVGSKYKWIGSNPTAPPVSG